MGKVPERTVCMAKKMTPSLEDYLEAIYSISLHAGAPVRLTDIAAALNVAKPSVNKAISTLVELEYVLHEKYADIRLTESGESVAMHVFRKHNALMTFLTLVLKVDPGVADAEACKIEHAISEDTAERLIRFIEDYQKS